MDGLLVARALVCAFFAVLFLQSGLDKVFDWKGNLGWLSGHFEKSPLRRAVPLMLLAVTLTECVAGLASAFGLVALLLGRGPAAGVIGLGLSGLALVMLFFGQRVAKDYPGAAVLASYFGVALIGLWLHSATP
jgi:uncharacterized membrane protein YphA (DoxX/SURF4 family)